jgi:hypothetical protein
LLIVATSWDPDRVGGVAERLGFSWADFEGDRRNRTSLPSNDSPRLLLYCNLTILDEPVYVSSSIELFTEKSTSDVPFAKDIEAFKLSDNFSGL